MKIEKGLVVALFAAFLFGSPTLARAGKYYNETMVWDGVTRYYRVYVPSTLPANPPMLIMLHATNFSGSNYPPTRINYG